MRALILIDADETTGRVQVTGAVDGVVRWHERLTVEPPIAVTRSAVLWADTVFNELRKRGFTDEAHDQG